MDHDLPSIRRLWLEHLTTSRELLAREYDIHLPVESAVEHDVATIAKFLPPSGRTVLALDGTAVIGTGSYRRIEEGVAEIKRMYVEPGHRARGLGRRLLTELLRAARSVGYRAIRLETAPYRAPALSLYRSVGFVAIPPYPQTDIPRQYWDKWVFMQLDPL